MHEEAREAAAATSEATTGCATSARAEHTGDGVLGMDSAAPPARGLSDSSLADPAEIRVQEYPAALIDTRVYSDQMT